MKDELQRTWQSLAADNVSGASEIYARVSAALVQRFAFLHQAKQAVQDWPQLLREMLQTQPTMAPLYNFANQLALIFEQKHLNGEERITQALALLQKEALQSPRSNAAIARNALAMIAEKPRVITHSYSSMVAAVLEYAFDQGVHLEVYLSEARPANEGRRMVERLARARIPIHFCVDDARGHFMNVVDLVLLGADRISEKTFVNKIGSRSVALLASAQKIPIAVLAARNKLWPARLPFGQEPARAREEVWSGAPPAVTLHNFYFEEVELHHAHSVITEGGIFSPEQMQNKLRSFHSAEFWKQF